MHDLIDRYAAAWDRNAELDARWVILADPNKLGSWQLDEFLRTGEEEIEGVLAFLDGLGVEVDPQGRFLDFGCGIGRLSRALAQHMASGIGMDISQRMIEEARAVHADLKDRVDFVVNREADLPQVPSDSVDLVYAHIVLQHIPAELQRGYIAEFLRVCRPGGIAVFQAVTDELPPDWRRRLRDKVPGPVRRLVRRLRGRPALPFDIEMHGIPEAVVREAVAANGEVVATAYSDSTDPGHHGAVRFFDRAEAERRVRVRETSSSLLSQFFVVRRI